MKRVLWRSPTVGARLSFVPTVDDERDQTDYANVNAVTNCDRFQFLILDDIIRVGQCRRCRCLRSPAGLVGQYSWELLEWNRRTLRITLRRDAMN